MFNGRNAYVLESILTTTRDTVLCPWARHLATAKYYIIQIIGGALWVNIVRMFSQKHI